MKIAPLFVLVFLFSCSHKDLSLSVSSIDIEEVYTNADFSTRAIEYDTKNERLLFAGNNNSYGMVNDDDVTFKTIPGVESKHEFRALGVHGDKFSTVCVASPALLFTVDGNSVSKNYEENHESVFYDSMQFWNKEEGIAFGDAVDGCMSVIITRDGGKTWNKVACEDFFPSKGEHEGAFAASNTNIAIVGDNAWLASGTRIFHTADKGKTWNLYSTPIIQEKETQGIYSIDFYDEKRGVAIGGNYTAPDSNDKNLIRTEDGGKTWKVIADADSPGYRSCIQYIPNSNGKGLVAVGFKGIDVSIDGGETWSHISDEGFYTVRFDSARTGYLAGKGRIAKFELN